LEVGPLWIRLQSPLDEVADTLLEMYDRFPCDWGDRFCDLETQVRPPSVLRRWYNPQVQFYWNEQSHFFPLPRHHAPLIWEWGLNYCITAIAHQYLLIHAAVLERHGEAWIFPAPPGSGKSTLTAFLMHNGWRLLSDEFALYDPGAGLVWPLPRPVSLKNQAIELVRDWFPQASLSVPVSGTNKGTVALLRPPTESVQQMRCPARPAWVVFPRWQAGAPFLLEPVSKGQALMRLADNSYNYALLHLQGFEALWQLVSRCRCGELTYSDPERLLSQLEQPRWVCA